MPKRTPHTVDKQGGGVELSGVGMSNGVAAGNTCRLGRRLLPVLLKYAVWNRADRRYRSGIRNRSHPVSVGRAVAALFATG
jgi:hypothetical protein